MKLHHPLWKLPKELAEPLRKVLAHYITLEDKHCWLCAVVDQACEAEIITEEQFTALSEFIQSSITGWTFLTTWAEENTGWTGRSLTGCRKLRIDWMEWLLKPENQE